MLRVYCFKYIIDKFISGGISKAQSPTRYIGGVIFVLVSGSDGCFSQNSVFVTGTVKEMDFSGRLSGFRVLYFRFMIFSHRVIGNSNMKHTGLVLTVLVIGDGLRDYQFNSKTG